MKNSSVPAHCRRIASLLVLSSLASCAPQMLASPDSRPDYLRYVAFESPGNEHVLLRWPKKKMPLKVFAPKPPAGLFDEPDALWRAARHGVLSWADAAGPGLPSFEFVDAASEADIPIAWAETSPDVSIAHCFYNIHILQRRFGVAQIVVTGRYRNGREATPEQILETLTHEVGHALGLGGHSPNPDDLMYGFIDTETAASERTMRELTSRDRETLRLLYKRPLGAGVRGAREAY